MPPRQNSNGKLPRPRSSSSISLNESPTEETNYDSDISDDDHAIAEGDDDDDEEDPDEGFELEVSTLTGNTFSVMIHPSDTVEVLKTRIAFQEGISPADQNLLLEQGNKLIHSSNNTIQELNINQNSKLTLVTNVASGVPYKACRDPGDPPMSSSSSSSKLAPTIRRNYNVHGNSYNNQHSNAHQASSVRLPKILTANNHFNNQDSSSSRYGMVHSGSSSGLDRLDEREWMQSLFNKVAQKEEDDVDEMTILDNINMDSTRSTAAEIQFTAGAGRPKRGNKFYNEEDGNLLVVQGDDGVILIIQKNTGQLLDDSLVESSNYDDNNNHGGGGLVDLDFGDGRIQRMGRHKSSSFNTNSTTTSYHSRRYYQDTTVHEKIKENAVTLEKMRQVRSMMAQKHRIDKSSDTIQSRPLEFPTISGGSKSVHSLKTNGNSDNQSVTYGNRSARSKPGGRRSINSSKMSLNRLIAEIYLQSKRKGRAFQPGQPPYTELQLVKYVQLKVAIILDEQRKSNTEPCSKCQLDGDWAFTETAPYLIPTVVMNRYKRLTNSRNSKSLDKDVTLPEPGNANSKSALRKSMIPTLVQKPVGAYPNSGSGPARLNDSTTSSTDHITSHNQNDVKLSTVFNTRRSSSSIPTSNRRFSTTSTKLASVTENNGNTNTTQASSCDISTNYTNNPSNVYRPSLKIYPRMQIYNNGCTSKKSSRPGSSSKKDTAKKAVRCQVCKKKLGIACRYQCRCGLTFCSTHRYAEAHECTFDYKTDGRNKIREENPVIVAPKIQNI